MNGGYLNSTEYITMAGTMPGPDMPMALSEHAMVAINSSVCMVIGGFNFDVYRSASTFYYDRIEGEWINGPTLLRGRNEHAAGIVTDEMTNENFVAVTGGGFDLTEILQDEMWIQGKLDDIFFNFWKEDLKIELLQHKLPVWQLLYS